MGNMSSKKKEKKDVELTEPTTLISHFRHLNGRRFHSVDGLKYFLPNDDDELDRLHLQHFIIRHVFQSNFSAPIEKILNSDGSKVLDVGCGAGSWMLEMATNYPRTEITGIDISPVQPRCIKPNNVTFVLANLLTGLTFEDETFDYVFQRLMFTAIPLDSWLNTVKELTRVLKPGGYLELSELGPPCRTGPVTCKVFNAVNDFVAKQNIDHKVLYKLRLFVEQTGQFEDICEEKNTLSYGEKMGKLGQAAIDNAKFGLINARQIVLPALGVTSEEFDEMLDIVAKELREFDTYHQIIRVYARKKEIT